MGSLRTIKYLVVDNVVDEVPDAAPEIDAAVSSAQDVAAALLTTAGVPSDAELYLQTFRPDGSARWQPISSIEHLPEVSVMVAKVVRSRGPPARPAAAPHAAPHPHPQQQQQHYAAAAQDGSSSSSHHGLGHAIGGLFKKLAVGGSSTGGAAGMAGAGMGRPIGGMGGMGMGGGRFDRDEDEYQRQLYEQQQRQELEDGAMRRDDDNDRPGWTDMDNNAGPDPVECEGHDADGDGIRDELEAEAGGGDWVGIDNEAGPEPEEDNQPDNEPDNDDGGFDNDDGGFDNDSNDD